MSRADDALARLDVVPSKPVVTEVVATTEPATLPHFVLLDVETDQPSLDTGNRFSSRFLYHTPFAQGVLQFFRRLGRDDSKRVSSQSRKHRPPQTVFRFVIRPIHWWLPGRS